MKADFIHINSNNRAFFNFSNQAGKGADSLRNRESKFTAPGKPGRVLKGLQNIFPLKIGKIGKQIVNTLTRSDLGNHHAHGNTHTPYAGFSPHKAGFLGNAVKLFVVHASECNAKSGGNQYNAGSFYNCSSICQSGGWEQ
jgi:hypothetical protein